MDVEEIRNHNHKGSCWIVVDGSVYDVTDFLSEHPGGQGIILEYAGKEASDTFHQVHSSDVLEEYISPDKHLGPVVGDLSALEQGQNKAVVATHAASTIPLLVTRVILDDFRDVAEKKLVERSRIYISSFSSSPQRHSWYRDCWRSISFRPRVMRDVSTVSSTYEMMGQASTLPIFIPPMDLIGLGHPDGELVFAVASARAGVHYCISTGTTKSYEEIAAAHTKEQHTTEGNEPFGRLFFQLYVNSDTRVTSELLRRIKTLGFRGLFITADMPVVGKRVEDRRLMARELLEAGPVEPAKLAMAGRAAAGVLSSTLNWKDLEWIRRGWKGPIAIKGIQSAEDAMIAADLGVEAVLLSNHGSRQLQDAPSSLETLLDIRASCPEILRKLEVYVDGSFATGADVVKALCLGAKAVGIGRPFFYAAAGYGAEGVLRAFEILREEVQSTLRMLGVRSLDELDVKLIRLPGGMRTASML